MNIRKKDKIIITGCPRSGTAYASKFFSINGIDVGHEQFGNNGISSWCLATANDDILYGPSWNEVKTQFFPCIVFHQVRNPIEVISSLMYISKTSFDFIDKYITINEIENKIERCMKIWLEWNLMSEKITHITYRVEDIENQFPYLEPWPDKKYNTRNKKPFTEEQMIKINPALWFAITDKAKLYGYHFEYTESIKKMTDF